MEELTFNELILTNGGNTVPVVSEDPSVQEGYSIGYRIGRALATTVNMFKSIF
ncbi:hypothetical protein [Tenacibaculum sp.]|uniref:hypothetical protein n=1 Tax=Tenacibaculum sp. TaxID=1906242 RepID=UPI003D137050